jgi:flagellar operon protein
VAGQLLPGQLVGRQLQPAAGAARRVAPASAAPLPPEQPQVFRQQLDEHLRTSGGVKFSAHAVKRLESRGIRLSPPEVAKVEAAVNRASAKGSRDSLVLSQNYALVVNIPSRTVITAFDQQQLRENVVTNVDSAVFVP